MLSYDHDRLLAPSKKKQVESALRLDQPLRLDRLALMLATIRIEFADYKLTKASIPPLISLPIWPPFFTLTRSAGELLGYGVSHTRITRS